MARLENRAGLPPRLASLSTTEATVSVWPGRTEQAYLLQSGASLSLTSTLTVSISSTGEGGLDTGTVAANTWYYVYMVPSAADALVPVLKASTSHPGIGPSGHTNFVYCGAMLTSATSLLDAIDYVTISPGVFVTGQRSIASGAYLSVPPNPQSSYSLSLFIPPHVCSSVRLMIRMETLESVYWRVGAWSADLTDSASGATDNAIAATLIATSAPYTWDGSAQQNGEVAITDAASPSVLYRCWRTSGVTTTVGSHLLRCTGWTDCALQRG